MIATLIRQDPAFRRLPFWIVMSSVWASAAAGVVAWIGARGDAVGIELLAALSQDTNFSVGCYCDNEALCHRSLLRQLLEQADAKIG